MPKPNAIVRIGTIEQRILLVRGEKVIMDADLAELYGVTTESSGQQESEPVPEGLHVPAHQEGEDGGGHNL